MPEEKYLVAAGRTFTHGNLKGKYPTKSYAN
jgi:hypothetical protein